MFVQLYEAGNVVVA